MSLETIGKPPGPDGFPFVGQAFAYKKHPAEFLLRLAQDYGDISQFRVGGYRMYLLNRPDFVQDVLVTSSAGYTKGRVLQRAKSLLGEGLLTSEGKHHLGQRRAIQPAFHRERLRHYADIMVECAARTRSEWRSGETRDVMQEMMRLTLAIVGRTLFSVDVEHEAADIGKALTDLLALFPLLVLPFSRVLEYLPVPSVVRAKRARRRLNQFIQQMIGERRRSGTDTGDLLSMLLFGHEHGAGTMNDRQVRDEAMTLILAGHETTAVALTWTWYLLSQHPEVMSRLQQELRGVLGERLPSFDDLPDLPYAEMVLAESMRLYPPVWAVGRMARRDMRVFNYAIPRGSVCLLSPYTMHRHPRYWPEPERFDPDRFLPEPREARPKFAYFPFGGGARKCVGEGFAWVEGVLLLAVIAQRWRMELAPGQLITTHPQITLRPRHGIKMTLHAA